MNSARAQCAKVDRQSARGTAGSMVAWYADRPVPRLVGRELTAQLVCHRGEGGSEQFAMGVQGAARDAAVRDAHALSVRVPQPRVVRDRSAEVRHGPQLLPMCLAQIAVAEQRAGEIEEDGIQLRDSHATAVEVMSCPVRYDDASVAR